MPNSLLFIIASLIWGSTFWAITQQLGSVPPAVSVVYRFSLAALCLFIWCAVRGERLRLSWRAQAWLALQGFFTFALSYVCTYSSEQYLVSALVSVLFALMVIWSPLLEHVFYTRPLNWRIWCAAAVAIAGVVLLFSPALHEQFFSTLHTQDKNFVLGLMLALVATIASTMGNIVLLQARQHESSVVVSMAWAMAWGSLWVACYALLMGEEWVLPDSSSYWLSLVYLSVFGSVIAFACYFTLIHRIGAQKTVFIGVVTPVISVLLSMRLEDYRPGALEIVGILLCLSSVVWVLRGKPVSN
ncbi:MAG: EamA family transporter [Burkholderiales bacterium]|nr:EamA family transporter [Burkholderiales bacterium]